MPAQASLIMVRYSTRDHDIGLNVQHWRFAEDVHGAALLRVGAPT